MIQTSKSSAALSRTPTEKDLELINKLTLRQLNAEEVFVFACAACNDLVDRDHERFPVETLEKLAPMFVGRTVIADHRWSSKDQTARIYRAEVVRQDDGHHDLMFGCYMLRNDSTADTIAALEGGILKEVSVGCSIGRAVCSVCGEEYGACGHIKGEIYGGKQCIVELQDPVDAYEMSFVAVPAQPGAGVTKNHEKTGLTSADMSRMKALVEIERERWN